MCGIVALISPASEAERESRLPRLAAGTPAAGTSAAADLQELKSALGSLEFPLVRHAYSDPEAYAEWRRIAGELRGAGDLHAADGPKSAEERLRRDLVWRIEHDLLDLADAIAKLLADPRRQAGPQAVWLAWQIELALRALGRLEVRGRDSAGLSLLLWLEDDRRSGATRSGATRVEELVAASEPLAVGSTTSAERRALPGCLLLTYKVAEEIGALGYNESTLRALITGDDCLQAAARSTPSHALVVTHTRWASNGLISVDNAHPVDGRLEPLAEGGFETPAGRTLAVINGDIDNFQDLAREIGTRGQIPAGVTADAKGLPALIELAVDATPDSALVAAMERIEGSLASVVARADRPGALWFTQAGTGQSLYLAVAGSTLMVTSEVYGCVEMTNRYWPIAAARDPETEAAVVLRVEADDRQGLSFHRLSGSDPVTFEPELRRAEITTRDVDRCGFTHFFRKELEEAVASVRKTIAGRYLRTSAAAAEPAVDFSALYDHWPQELVHDVEEGGIHRFVFIGQGSAHVAGSAGARFMADTVGHRGVVATAITAGDFSAHELRSDLDGTCLVAISQSGTTTDTNRCVTLAKNRGARVIGIVNRRNSTLVDLCDAVIYTSDGRDVEMAVASTKAFYSQVTAAFLLSQHMGLVTGALVPSQIGAALAELERLPEVMTTAFALEPAVAECAREVGLKRRHWSLLGTGPSMAAADEIRIKFSELCYKSVSVDFLENKKHIDLSAEPLILAALPDLRSDLISDAAKEVSIFAAHQAITVVFCDRGSDAYRAYTPYVFEAPPIGYGLSVITTAMLGHLFAYHTAITMDGVAQRLRRLRKALLRSAPEAGPGAVWSRRGPEAEGALELLKELFGGDFDALWPARTAARLAMVFRLLSGAASAADETPMSLASGGEPASDVDEWCRNQLSESIAEADRPIDSIRHQAKTITVGTSRSGYSKSSILERSLLELGVDIEDLELSFHRALVAIDDLLDEIPSGIRYEASGEVPEDGEMRVVEKIGGARRVDSRFERGAPIAGTKLASIRRRQLMVVTGIRDEARLLVFPILREGVPAELVLLHLRLRQDPSAAQKVHFLQAFPQRAEQLIEHYEEILGRRVEIGELAALAIDSLVFARLDELPPRALEPSISEELVLS